MSTLQVNRIIPLTGSSVYIQGAVIDSASFAYSASYSDYAATASYIGSVGYNHTEAVASTTWTITHNLNNQHPLVQTYDSNHLMLIPQSVSGSSTSTVIVTFSTPTAGYARVV